MTSSAKSLRSFTQALCVLNFERTSETWTKVSPTPIDDGRAWRKYGQKEILNAKYPRFLLNPKENIYPRRAILGSLTEKIRVADQPNKFKV
ncbi:hypothetical protein HHK36_018686 [Tetracentron sinense]|uniref:WRKY domain-containing protein n=1 Tax=Tetracentron sinense TaxID=13715 RepID=A0A835DB23_TETSI|nr:hypothetical protein HHK36_018686 [Tetracentron sinense]